MSLPITAVGPLKVETNPILMESAAIAGFASAKAVAPASQNAVLISVPPPQSAYAARQMARARTGSALGSVFGLSFLRDAFCARNRWLAASTNRRLPLRTFGSCPSGLHHSSQQMRMARIIVLLRRPELSGPLAHTTYP